MDGRVGLVARCLAPLAAALAIGLAPRAFAQLRADPVETLRQELSATTDDVLERDRRTKACLGELRSLGELHKAVVLREWRHRHPDARLAAVDQQNRDALAERFRQATRQVLAGRDPAAALAALEMLGETAAAMRAVGEPPVLTRPLTPDVARLVGEGEPAVRAAAAKALGLIEPDLAVTLPLLALQVKSPDAAVRLDATAALGQILETTAQPWTGNQFDPAARLDRRGTADAAAKLLAPLGQAAVDPSGEVRHSGLTALALAATLLGKLTPPARVDVPDSVEGARAARLAEAEREEARPLALALREQLAAVNRCLRGRDAAGKVLALKVCEEAAQARLRWLQRPGTPADDPLAAPLAAALPALAPALTDDSVDVRRATLDALELYGPLASAAAPAVTRALKDADPFVRWSAVRTLGGIGPAARPAVPALTKLLQDPDLDVRQAAAGVLETLDPTGQGAPKKPGQAGGSRPRSALPALIQALGKKDSDTRLAAIHALAAMGDSSRPAVPALAEAMRDADPRVRLAAVQALGRLGPAAKSAADALRQAMRDDNADVRRAAADALLDMEREP